MKYRLYQIDSFTKKRFTGNPAGVVTNADGLDEAAMQKIARELNNSETAFVFRGKTGEYDWHVRFFTPRMEVPMCGHATIAAHYALAVEQKLSTARVIQKVGAGCLPVDILRKKENYRIIMTQGPLHFNAPVDPSLGQQITDAMGLNKDDMLPAPVQIVSSGHGKVFVPVRSFTSLKRLTPDFSRLIGLSEEIRCNGYLAFAPESPIPGCSISARMFGPAMGIDEDPVNGSSGGALGGYLIRHHLLSAKGKPKVSFKVYQGFSVGREGVVEVEIELDEKGQPAIGRIAGDAVIVFMAEVEIP